MLAGVMHVDQRQNWHYKFAVAIVFSLFSCSLPAQQRASLSPADADGLHPILTYIQNAWDTLSRSMSDCGTVVDPKLVEASVLYLPAGFPKPDSVRDLAQRCHVEVRELPLAITGPGQVATNITPPGLLYLANRYVVPGGRFNEMYGWDSYFIVRGLLEDKRIDLARGMVENFFFEIEHYGTVLNANRTYFLTRSQPPFLTSMIMGVYEAEKAAGKDDRELLEKGYRLAAKDYEMWVREPHLAGDTGLSRYSDFGTGPAPESLKDETDFYRQVTGFFLLHAAGRNYVVETGANKDSVPVAGSEYEVKVCDVQRTMARPGCEPAHRVSLAGDYYKGDRAMRESGFDISFRFGPYGAGTHHYAPVCLNSLLYKTEKDLEQMSQILGRKDDAKKWGERAQQRKERMQKYLWDAQRGLFLDYSLDSSARSSYEYITTFYPLWAGLATNDQAEALRCNLPIFEHAGGLAMSKNDTGVQWDYPYGWAPTQLLAIEGLRGYGFNQDADRISYEFLSTVAENFRRDGTIREKYDVVTRSSEARVAAGYQQNVVGFGWTNGAFLALLHALPADQVARLAREQQKAPAAQ
ncbi:MAG TPA: trehalase family glycosidase [Terriglobales bacterium]|nr:trehalase family glycosidase [Terriglobales bacterium]